MPIKYNLHLLMSTNMFFAIIVDNFIIWYCIVILFLCFMFTRSVLTNMYIVQAHSLNWHCAYFCLRHYCWGQALFFLVVFIISASYKGIVVAWAGMYFNIVLNIETVKQGLIFILFLGNWYHIESLITACTWALVVRKLRFTQHCRLENH